jgi:hypothetical protein
MVLTTATLPSGRRAGGLSMRDRAGGFGPVEQAELSGQPVVLKEDSPRFAPVAQMVRAPI